MKEGDPDSSDSQACEGPLSPSRACAHPPPQTDFLLDVLSSWEPPLQAVVDAATRHATTAASFLLLNDTCVALADSWRQLLCVPLPAGVPETAALLQLGLAGVGRGGYGPFGDTEPLFPLEALDLAWLALLRSAARTVPDAVLHRLCADARDFAGITWRGVGGQEARIASLAALRGTEEEVAELRGWCTGESGVRLAAALRSPESAALPTRVVGHKPW